MVDSSENPKLHVVIFPWLAFGHINAYLELSKCIAQKGHKVSIVSTPRNIDRLPKLSSSLRSLISFVKLTLPKIEGLPEKAEATMDVCRNDVPYLAKAFDGLEPEFTRFLQRASPDWVIYDFLAHWVPPLTKRMGISCAFFSTISSWFVAFIGGSTEALINGDDGRKNPKDWMRPPKWVQFPSNMGYRTYESNFIIRAHSDQTSGVSTSYRVGMAIDGSDIILVRHCMEFEPEWLGLLEELHHKPIVPVGLMPPSAQPSGDDNNETWLHIKQWLDASKSKGSMVVYVALGSEVTVTQDQITELALGLELSGLPFLWALRKSNKSHSLELPDGFLERTNGRGLVCTSWTPQLKILGHESVGGFLTHCGWSSIVEGLTFGHPLIMLPFQLDQGLNARVLVDKRVGIEVPRNELEGSFKRIGVAESLHLIMVDDEGRSYWEKAKEMSALFGDKDLHNRYMDNFIVNYLEAHRSTIHASS